MSIKNEDAYENQNFNEDDLIVCAMCGSMPCEWIEFGKSLLENANVIHPKDGDGERSDDKNVVADDERVLKTSCRMLTRAKHGHLGKGNIIPLPNCVLQKIRDAFPDPEDDHVGFHEEQCF